MVKEDGYGVVIILSNYGRFPSQMDSDLYHIAAKDNSHGLSRLSGQEGELSRAVFSIVFCVVKEITLQGHVLALKK